jgi:hypothetical protein
MVRTPFGPYDLYVRTLIDLMEETLGRSLDADFVADTASLTVADLENLREAYTDYAATFVGPTHDGGEFWPLSYELMKTSWLRDPSLADDITRSALSQLLYAHGALVLDELGALLARTLAPKYSTSRGPRWTYRSTDKDELANYFEALAYLRPLIDAHLVVFVPRPYVGYGPIMPYPDDFFDIREVGGDNRHRAVDAAFDATKSLWGSEYPLGLWAIYDKLARLGGGLQGDLNLETRDERSAFDWLTARHGWVSAKRADAESLVLVERLTCPHVENLQPSDVLALRGSDVWPEFRVVLKRGLAGLRDSSDPASRVDGLLSLREELEVLKARALRAAKRSAFLTERVSARKDLAIGAVVAGAAAPVLGPAAAVQLLSLASARAGIGLLWSWLAGQRDDDSEGVARCFGVLSSALGRGAETRRAG